MTLSIVIPAYNEEENIEKTVRDVFSHFPDCELVIVNDCSTDRTGEILKRLQEEFHNIVVFTNEKNSGHGRSVIEGLTLASGEYVLYIDADRQISLDNLKKLRGKQIDWISGKRMHRNDKLFRKVISFCLRYTILFRHFMYIHDSNCPFKLYRAEILKPLLKEVPETHIVPIACLEVIARKHKVNTQIIQTPHYPYDGVRKGFLQSFNPKMYKFLLSAFFEITRL